MPAATNQACGCSPKYIPGRELGDRSVRPQAEPACPEVPGEIAQAFPDAGGIPAVGHSVETVRGRGHDDAVCDRVDPPPDAERVPLGRNPLREIDGTARVLRLRDSKTGPRMVPLTGPIPKVLGSAASSGPRVCPWCCAASNRVPGSPVTEADARNLVNPLRRALRRAGHSPPPPCTTTPESVREWFDYLGRLRERWGDYPAAEV